MGSRKGRGDLGIEERRKIADGKLAGKSSRVIARELGRHHSTINKELARGSEVKLTSQATGAVSTVYDFYTSQQTADKAKKNKGRRRKVAIDCEVLDAVMQDIVAGYSPYAALQISRICGNDVSVCLSTIYNYVHSGLYLATDANLLRPPKAPRTPKEVEKREAKTRPAEFSIDNRPKEVCSRLRFGHWEGDLVLSPYSNGEGGLLTLVERKSRLGIVLKVANKQQDEIARAIDLLENIFGEMFYKIIKTITFDNGVEFINYDKLTRSTVKGRGSPRFAAYYAHPYCSGERGSNENYNGFLRRYYPKGTDFSQVSEQELLERVSFVNNYPRKILGGQSASKIFIRRTSPKLPAK